MLSKKELRRRYLDERKEHDINEIRNASQIIAKKLAALPDLKAAKAVMTYISIGKETQTTDLIEELLKSKKKVYVPVCDKKNHTMSACRLRNTDDLKSGAYGIPEPGKKEYAAKRDIDICIIPGCVFGENMHRIGYGMGFYDRFMSDADFIKIGICCDFSVIKNVPNEKTDVPLDMIITEKRIIKNIEMR